MVRAVRSLSFGISFVALAALAGCGGAGDSPDPAPGAAPATATGPAEPAGRTPGTAAVEGVVDGAPLAFVDAVVVAGTHGARVLLVDRSDYCEHPNASHPAARTLTLDLGPHGAPDITPGDYDVPEAFADTSHELAARLDVIAASCRATSTVMSLAGTATVETATPTSIAGSFTIALGRDKVRGSFTASPCPSLPPNDPIRCE